MDVARSLSVGATAHPAAIAQWVRALRGRRRISVAFFAGSLSVLAFAPVFASPILFATFPILIWLIDGSQRPHDAAVAGWWFAFGYFFFNLFWIGEAFLVEADKFAWLLPFAITLLPAGLAILWACAAYVARHLWPTGAARILVLALVFSVIEWVRGHIFTGLPWNVPGYALTAPLPLMQSAGLFGIYGLTLIALLIFSAPLVLLADGRRPLSSRLVMSAMAAAVVPLAMLWAYGAWRLSTPQTYVDGVTLRIVQPSVLQTEKWRPEHQRRIFDEHLSMSLTDHQGRRDDLVGITHVVWPEAAMPFFPLESPQALAEIAEMLPVGRVLITGAIRRETATPSGNADDSQLARMRAPVFNSILVFDSDAQPIAQYDKIHLVPFGEYLPADTLLSVIGLKKLTAGRGAFTPGIAPPPMMIVPGLPPVAGIVCYEALFPEHVADAYRTSGLILNVTNDGWFGNTSGPRQHFHQTRVRAVEQGLPVLRAANNGISGMIDGHGRVIAALGLNERAVADTRLPKPLSTPPYAKWGDWAFLLLLALASAALVIVRRAERALSSI
jgi:apolipoprotein N-acyltransferase